ncbi:hypothetical protein HPB50_022152 [Hyalomma asiaticum]|uniref:Uncharacterized protein n=1 Tax=Hyalomma asiaticum TaxID=266040 RepID=A0ACB7S0T7_HYAAI|nr:hypothetical protein HPB50_022152 [Hyalomma asiaticum]
MHRLFYYVQLFMLLVFWIPLSPETLVDTSDTPLPQLLLSEPMVNCRGLHDMHMRRSILSTTGPKISSSSTLLLCDGIDAHFNLLNGQSSVATGER